MKASRPISPIHTLKLVAMATSIERSDVRILGGSVFQQA